MAAPFGTPELHAYDSRVLALILTLVSLVLTIVVGGVFIVGLHRLVQWVVGVLEARAARPRTVTIATDDRELTAH
jgi:hypothetical protein